MRATVSFTELGGNIEMLPIMGGRALSQLCEPRKHLSPFLKYANLMAEVTYILKKLLRLYLVQNIK